MADSAQIYDELTEREIEIVALLAEGLTNKEIAGETGLTLYTVKWYLKEIYSKLYVSNRTEAAKKAQELGILESPGVSSQNSYLPQMVTPFFGREAELRQIRETLATKNRLLTIHGFGGMGKTRLAIEFGERYQDEYPDGVCFVSLAQVDNSPLQSIADTLNLSPHTNRKLIDELQHSLWDKQILFILDNFEHMLQYAREITQLLQQTRYLQLIVTSREPLNLQGEEVFTIEGLDIQQDQLDTIESSGAYQLYLERARKTFQAFEPEQEDQQAIASICQLVGGMPLAIELAAAWTSVLSPQKTYQQLLKDIDLLVASDQDRPKRHQSVRATFEHSWRLLAPATQDVLTSLAVFHQDGFTYQVAEKIAGATAKILKELIDVSLLYRKNQKKFAFHPLIYQFVRERLQADKARHLELQENHLSFYHHYVVNLIKMVRDNLDIKIIRDFEDEAYNLNQAWFFALKTKQYDVLETSVEIGYVCEIANFWNECDTQFRVTERLLPEGLPLLRGRMLAFRSIFAFRLLDYETHTRLAYESWELLKESPYIVDAALALSFQAIGLCFQKQYDAALHLVDQIEPVLYRDDLYLPAYARYCLEYTRPTVTLFQGQPKKALPLLQKIPRVRWLYLSNHLAECYIELNMSTEARRELELNYQASMQAKSYQTALTSALYLSYITNENWHSMHRDVLSTFTEIAKLDQSYLHIGNLIHRLGQYCILRGYGVQAKLAFSVNAKILSRRGYRIRMMQYLLEAAQMLQHSDPHLASSLLMALLHEPDCPTDIKQQSQALLENFEYELYSLMHKLEDLIQRFYETSLE